MATAAIILAAADALVEALNSATFTSPYPSLGATRSYAPRYTLEELAELKVTVIPPGGRLERSSRATAQGDWVLAVGVQKRTDGTDAEADELMLLAQEIATFLLAQDLDLTAHEADGTAHAVTVEFDPLYDPSLLREERTFTSVLVATFVHNLDL